MSPSRTSWLSWAREIQALGQTGLAYSQSDYDSQRYRRLIDLAAEIVAAHTQLTADAALLHRRWRGAVERRDFRGGLLCVRCADTAVNSAYERTARR